MVPTKMEWLTGEFLKGLPLPKQITTVCLENRINHMFILKLERSFSTLSSNNKEI